MGALSCDLPKALLPILVLKAKKENTHPLLEVSSTLLDPNPALQGSGEACEEFLLCSRAWVSFRWWWPIVTVAENFTPDESSASVHHSPQLIKAPHSSPLLSLSNSRQGLCALLSRHRNDGMPHSRPLNIPLLVKYHPIFLSHPFPSSTVSPSQRSRDDILWSIQHLGPFYVALLSFLRHGRHLHAVLSGAILPRS